MGPCHGLSLFTRFFEKLGKQDLTLLLDKPMQPFIPDPYYIIQPLKADQKRSFNDFFQGTFRTGCVRHGRYAFLDNEH